MPSVSADASHGLELILDRCRKLERRSRIENLLPEALSFDEISRIASDFAHIGCDAFADCLADLARAEQTGQSGRIQAT